MRENMDTLKMGILNRLGAPACLKLKLKLRKRQGAQSTQRPNLRDIPTGSAQGVVGQLLYPEKGAERGVTADVAGRVGLWAARRREETRAPPQKEDTPGGAGGMPGGAAPAAAVGRGARTVRGPAAVLRPASRATAGAPASAAASLLRVALQLSRRCRHRHTLLPPT